MKKLLRRVKKVVGLCVGLDLHKKFIQVSVLNRDGDEILSERMPATASSLTELLDRLGNMREGGKLEVALEASGCFVWVYDLLAEKIGKSSVHVAAPSKVKVIAESGEKTDAGDAWWLAYLLQEGRLPEAFVACDDLRELRIACREHRSVTDRRSDLMRRMRSHLAQLGLSFDSRAWSSVAGRQKIRDLVAETEAKHGMRGCAISRLWRRIQVLSEEVRFWKEQVELFSKRFKEVALLDDQLPGVGTQIAAITWSEMGDPVRYRGAKAYGKGTGMTPGYRESGGRRQKKGIQRDGSSLVRWALTRAVMSCMRCRRGAGVAVKEWVKRMMRRKSKKVAIVAAARKLAESIWRLFALGESFDLRRVFPV